MGRHLTPVADPPAATDAYSATAAEADVAGLLLPGLAVAKVLWRSKSAGKG
jgi:hypothetical protein